MPQFHEPVYRKVAELDSDFYEKLTDAGFMLDFGEDHTGLHMKYLRRGSGYYIDVGASELVAEGKIKLKSNVSIDHIKSNSVVLTDGSVERFNCICDRIWLHEWLGCKDYFTRGSR